MSLIQSNVIDPHIPWTGWGDYAFNDDVNAITVYIEDQRPHIKEHPELQTVIDEYENWLVNLSWYDKYMTPETSLGKAVFYRNKVNGILGQVIPVTDIPGDIENKIIPVNPAESEGAVGTIIKSVFGDKVLTSVKTIVVIGVGGVIIYLFGPAIRNIFRRMSEKKLASVPNMIPSHVITQPVEEKDHGTT